MTAREVGLVSTLYGKLNGGYLSMVHEENRAYVKKISDFVYHPMYR